MTSTAPALCIEGLVKRYKSGTVAVRGIDLSIPEGTFFGLLGPNGAGKTTTIACITGTALPSEGTIHVFGNDVVANYRKTRADIGLSPQEFNVDFFGTVEKTLDYIGGYFGMPQAKRKQRSEELMERFSLTKYRSTPFNQLSGGYKRRLVLARALMHDPRLLILDEPTAGVDVETRRDLWQYLEDLNKAGKTIILTSHYIEEVQKLTSRVAIIANGTIIREDATSEYTKDGRSLEDVYLSLIAGDSGAAEKIS
jgi:ABC-2 type transport system ATP-binding protein